MSSFFNRQPEFFDAKKRLGSGGTTPANNSASATSVLAAADLLDDVDSAPESWVELAPSRNSLCSSVEQIAMPEPGGNGTGGEQSLSKDSRLSPVSLQSPKSRNSNSNDCSSNSKVVESSLEQVKYRLAKDSSMKNTTDWIWDWSSRPEAHPNMMIRNRSDNGTTDHNSGNAGIGSAMTTPPNSPAPEHLSEFQFGEMVKEAEAKQSSSSFRLKVLMGLVVSNLMTFVLGASIGFYLCKKWSRGQTGGSGSSAAGLLSDNCLGSGQTLVSYYNW